MEYKSMLYENRPLAYQTRTGGNGGTVLLLHGFGEDGSIWQSLYEGPALAHRLIVPDLPGSGRSAPLPGSPSIDDLAAAVKAVLDHEQVGSCTVLGHSMGGYIALAMAERYPGLFKGLGLVHSTAYADSGDKREARRKSIAFIRSNGAAAFLKTAIPGLFGPVFTAANPAMVAALTEKYSYLSADSLVQYYEAMMQRPDRTAVLAGFGGPVLLLAGVHDAAVPFAQSCEQAHLAAESHVCFLQGSGHMGMIEEPERFGQAIAAFIGRAEK
jgi:pimeloyl-ACP methyl ester carboxylesterase